MNEQKLPEAVEQKLNVGLPKWPQCIISGDTITEDQAFDIILRTDGFLTCLSGYSGGNNHKFNEAYIKQCVDGLDLPHQPPKPYTGSAEESRYFYALTEEVRKELGFVDLYYIYNRFASTSYLGGPCGFVSPDGSILFQENLGKYPGAECVYRDFQKITDAWPFLNMSATLYDGEYCDEGANPVITFKVYGGVVEILDTPENPKATLGTRGEEYFTSMFAGRFGDNDGKPRRDPELGLSDVWYMMAATKVNLAISKILENGFDPEKD